MDKDKLRKYIDLRRKVLDDLYKIQQYLMSEENGDTEDEDGEFTINSGYELCEFENDNIEIPPNTLSLFDISNTIQSIRDFDETNELEKENGLK